MAQHVQSDAHLPGVNSFLAPWPTMCLSSRDSSLRAKRRWRKRRSN